MHWNAWEMWAALAGAQREERLTAHPHSTFLSHRYNESLLEEGKMMHRLRHERVVKLLGIIMEEGNYSLVMEYMKKGNLMHVLKSEVWLHPTECMAAPCTCLRWLCFVFFCRCW